MKGRVVVLKEYLKPFVIEEYEVPDPEPGATVLRITQAGICGSDLLNYGANTTPETVLGGHEVAGDIVELGDGVDTRQG